jgi:hypothetical protein
VGILKGKPDGGQGGKRGHSNMDHWVFTEEIKEASRKRRRISAKREITEGLIENEMTLDDQGNRPDTTDEFSR